VNAILREAQTAPTIIDRGRYVDFGVSAASTLGPPSRVTYRLYAELATTADLRNLVADAQATLSRPVALVPFGADAGPAGLAKVEAVALAQTFDASGVLETNSASWTVSGSLLADIRAVRDARLSLIGGPVWLRTLSRNRVPLQLKWTARPAHELFEQAFFLTMTGSFHVPGLSWGTRKRGQALPDGMLDFGLPTLYDAKAAHNGFRMEHRDVLGFADYLAHPQEWRPPTGVVPRFLVISSQFNPGTRGASFAGRSSSLAARVPGARLSWLRAADLARFAIAVERAQVTPEHRRSIDWMTILDAGDVGWDAFDAEINRLHRLGYDTTGA
jgi:hypothetical protein